MEFDSTWERGLETAKILLPMSRFFAEKNRKAVIQRLEKVATDSPPISDPIWKDISHVVGVLAKGSVKFTCDERLSLLSGLIWAATYEKEHRPEKWTERLEQLRTFLSNSDSDGEFKEKGIPGPKDLEKLPSEMSELLRSYFCQETEDVSLEELFAEAGEDALVENESEASTATVSDAPDLETVIANINERKYFLSKSEEDSNLRKLESARRSPNDPSAIAGICTLCWIIYKKYVELSIRGRLPEDQDLKAALDLARFVALHDNGTQGKLAQRNAVMLECLLGLHRDAVDPDTITAKLLEAATHLVEKGMDAEHPLREAISELLIIVTNHFQNQRKLGHLDKSNAEKWVHVFSSKMELLPARETKDFVEEVKLHQVGETFQLLRLTGLKGIRDQGSGNLQLPDLLDEPDQSALSNSILQADARTVRKLLQPKREEILDNLSSVLSHERFTKIQEPSRSVLIERSEERFQEARNLIQSSDRDDRLRGLTLFTTNEAETTHHFWAQVAREWSLWAHASVYNPPSVAGEWEKELASRRATPETAWNLAVAYCQVTKYTSAVRVLEDGIKTFSVPFIHLRFALYAAVQSLRHLGTRPETSSNQDYQYALTFLVENLTKWPLAVCYLAWVLLVGEQDSSSYDELTQSQKITMFQKLLDSPVEILDPEKKYYTPQLEAFRADLQKRLLLNDTWLLWINDYASRNWWFARAWYMLSEACEMRGFNERAEEAILQVISRNLKNYQNPDRKREKEQDNAKHLCNSLIALFSFYKRQSLVENIKAAVKRYRQPIRDFTERPYRNKRLLDLLRGYLTEDDHRQDAATPSDQSRGWPTLYASLQEVNNVDQLARLRPQIEASFDLLPGKSHVQECARFVGNILSNICGLTSPQWNAAEAGTNIAEVNYSLEQALEWIEGDPSLKPLKPIVTAMIRSFANLSKTLGQVAAPIVSPDPLGQGLPQEVSESSLVLHVQNPGPGHISNLRAICRAGDIIKTQDPGLLNELQQNADNVLRIGVIINKSHPNDLPSTCDVQISYDWSVMKGQESDHTVQLKWFSFAQFLTGLQKDSREIPNPYIEKPIDFEKDDHRLFQGRKDEIEDVKRIFLEGKRASRPLYFFGIRKVGKTSLRNKIAYELQSQGLTTVLTDLQGISAKDLNLSQTINLLSETLLRDCVRTGLDIAGLESIPVDHPNPMARIEPFFEELGKRSQTPPLILLIDEFQELVAPTAKPLLDILRKLYANNTIRFILFGWKSPELLAQGSPWHLDLDDRRLDFLSKDNVANILTEPVSDFDVLVPAATVDAVYNQTAGNPFHVTQLASRGIRLLNSECRTVVAPQDMNNIADLLSRDHAYFASSSFSPLLFQDNPRERDEAIRFAKELAHAGDSVPEDEVLRKYDHKIVEALCSKNVLEVDMQNRGVRVKGQMLATYLRERLLVAADPLLNRQDSGGRRVGLFVDIENILSFAPPGCPPKEFGSRFINYAKTKGNIVCAWAAFDPRNFRDPMELQVGIETSGMKVRLVRQALLEGRKKENLADFELIEVITEETEHSKPEIYIIAAHDKDFFAKVDSLVSLGFEVRLLCSTETSPPKKKLADEFFELERKTRAVRRAEGYPESNFFLDEIEGLFSV